MLLHEGCRCLPDAVFGQRGNDLPGVIDPLGDLEDPSPRYERWDIGLLVIVEDVEPRAPGYAKRVAEASGYDDAHRPATELGNGVRDHGSAVHHAIAVLK